MYYKSLDAQKQLERIFLELNTKYFEQLLPPIPVNFSGRLQTTGGQYFKSPIKKIQISARYFEKDNPWDEIRNTLGHEMVHYWLDYNNLPCGHTPLFYSKMRECGFDRYSRLTPKRHFFLYHCPCCKREFHRKRRGVWSCGPCSGKRFNPLYQLVLADLQKSP